jgi:hypothetical protein
MPCITAIVTCCHTVSSFTPNSLSLCPAMRRYCRAIKNTMTQKNGESIKNPKDFKIMDIRSIIKENATILSPTFAESLNQMELQNLI